MAARAVTLAHAGAVPRERAVLLTAAGAAFLALLDTTVANLAVADVRSDLSGTTVAGATWIITIYAVAFAALLAPAGRVADVVGRRALLLWGVAAFTAMSLAAALAAAAGPAIGGVLVDAVGWRALFLINVPVGLAIVAGARLLPRAASLRGRLPDVTSGATRRSRPGSA
jgi:MFS family permease